MNIMSILHIRIVGILQINKYKNGLFWKKYIVENLFTIPLDVFLSPGQRRVTLLDNKI